MVDDTEKEKSVEVTLPEDAPTEVELSDKTAKIAEEKSTVKVRDEDEVTATVDDREKALNDLKRQYEHQKRIAEAEREARRQAEQFARQQAQQVHTAKNEVQDSNLRIILNAIDATEQAAAAAERDYADAMAAGDYNLAAKAQRAIAQAESHLLQLNNGKSKLEEVLQQNTSEGAVYEPKIPNFEPQVQSDPVEMYASRLAPKSAEWLRNHPEAVNKINKLTRAHQDAVEDGVVPESPEYFQFIEERLGYSREIREEPQQRPREAPKKSIVSAPVTSNSTASSSYRANSSSNTMVLSPAEVEMAILAEPELPRDKAIESYARNKQFLIKQGKLSA